MTATLLVVGLAAGCVSFDAPPGGVEPDPEIEPPSMAARR
jgi:hypothetical protein